MAPKSDPIESSLDRLGELRHSEAQRVADFDEIRAFLRNRSNLVVAKAAKITGELRITVLVPDLLAAFNRFMPDAPRRDKRCAAITEIVTALYEMDYTDPEQYLAGLKHFQLEASFGPPVDEAAKLRGISAQGLLRTRHPDALSEVVQLLVDPEPPARLGAVRALATNGGEAGVLLLRLKVLTGDRETEVLGECFAGLLAASPERSVSFVAGYVDSKDDATAEAAILALGESRLQSAFEVLKEKWGRTINRSLKKILLVALAASKLEEAIDFLVALVETENVQVASDGIDALAIYKRNERVRAAMQQALSLRREKALHERFAGEFLD